MANNTFFISWQLWLQLTFCLGSAILLVFLAGLVKLFFKNRLVAKHVVLDEEKRARQQEMQSTGLPLPRKLDIPFGVRAIQSGIEVDGIWISRPNTPADSDTASKAPSREVDSKGKERAVRPSQTTRQSTQNAARRLDAPRRAPHVVSSSAEYDLEDAEPMGLRMPSPGSPATYKPKQSSRSQPIDGDQGRSEMPSSREARRSRLPKLETYTPSTSNGRSPHISSMYSGPHGRRDSSSSDENIRHQYTRQSSSKPKHVETPTRKRSPFDDPESASPTMDFLEDGGYFSSAAAPVHHTTESARSRQPSQSGSVHANIQTRRVNAGFEVLPAGTFTRTNSDIDLESQAPRGSARLQRKARS